MINLQTKQLLKTQINTLLKKVKENNFAIQDNNLPSLSIWCFYEEFINEIMKEFPMNIGNNTNLEIFDLLELDNYYVNAHNSLEKTKEEIINFCDRILKKLI